MVFISFFFGLSSFRSSSVKATKQAAIEQMNDLKSYCNDFLENNKDKKIQESDLVKLKNYIYDTYEYNCEIDTNLDSERGLEKPYLSIKIFKENLAGGKIQVENLYFE